jgi:Domain of unknown function (DUF4249)
MNKIKFYSIFSIIALSVFTLNCTEPIDIDNQLVFEDAIVVEATITNEFKYHKIFLTRTFKFEDDEPNAETNASVQIVDSANNTYNFIEDEPGVYISTSKFKANLNTDYQLFITTKDNKKYTTANKQLTNITQIDNIYASREVNSVGTEVMTIFVDSFDPNRNSNYYRYEYEETYKIIAPKWSSLDFIILFNEYGNALPQPGFVVKSKEERICYKTDLSNSIIQTITTNLSEDRVSKFAVRNIPVDDAIISHRYSILVKQYVQSLEAFNYYSILNQLSSSESLFSQIQPGFINSNIFSIENKNEKVLGFFEVTSVSQKRLFFNYIDFFPNEPLPPYFIDCGEISLPIIDIKTGAARLLMAIKDGQVKYFRDNLFPALNQGPYWEVPSACGDCTQLGSNIKPDFWVD